MITKLTERLEHPHLIETVLDVSPNISDAHQNSNIATTTSEAAEFKQLNVFPKVGTENDGALPSSLTNKNIPKQIQVMPLFIDKIVITIDIPVKYREMIIERMKNDGTYKGGSFRYKHLLNVALNKEYTPYLNADKTGDTYLRIEAESRNPNYNFMRFEWNPAKVDVLEVALAIEHFIPHLWTYQDVLTEARITRVDITVDLLNISIDQLLFYSKRKPYSDVWDRSTSKGGKTIYLGAERSQQRFCVYDKRAQIKKKNSQKISSLKEAIPTVEITRAEFRLRPDQKMTVLDLPKIKNPFLDLQIYAYPSQSGLNDDLFVQTLARARYEGLSKSLRSLSDKKNRKKCLSLMKAHEEKSWDPVVLWTQMPNVIEKLINPY